MSLGFGRRPAETPAAKGPVPSAIPAAAPRKPLPHPTGEINPAEGTRTPIFFQNKKEITESLLQTVNSTEIANMSPDEARKELTVAIQEVISILNITLTRNEREAMTHDILNDLLGYGPLESLLQRDDIADIMVNGMRETFIETGGKIVKADIRFNSEQQLMTICQRMAQQVGRRVDSSSPICDARLPDGSRINVIIPPLAIDGPTLTIRKFKAERLRIKNLVEFGAISTEGAEVLRIIGRTRCNIIVSGGTGSGKTTLLNCLGEFIEPDERTITCEDTAELQLQQPHVVRLETRPANTEGTGEVKMSELVKNCLRMRPDRIIVGEVRGPEAFDLLQAMNTGHDGSMGTLHANSPREAIARLESMVMMGQSALPSKVIRELIRSSVNIIVQTKRLRDGSRRITHITEVAGIEGDTITLQDLFLYDIKGEGRKGEIIGEHVATGIMKPAFYERARYFKEEEKLQQALHAASKGKK